jgi:hypothetical protein
MTDTDQAREAILEDQVNSKGGVTSLSTPPSRSEAQAGQGPWAVTTLLMF